jgi:ribA/ribD-fused uncharacterized protein
MNSESHLRIYSRREAAVFRTTTGEFGALSNMAPNFPLLVNGLRISTVEALYQACRFPDHPELQMVIIDQLSPMTAKMKSKRYRSNTRADWDRIRIKVMRWCLRVKLAQKWSRFGAALQKTGARPIVEESLKDDFWGAKPKDDGTLVGMNVLGRLLMELREQFRSAESYRLKIVDIPNIPHFVFLGKPPGCIGSKEEGPSESQDSMFKEIGDQKNRPQHQA